MEKTNKYSPSHPQLKPLVSAIVFWRRSPKNKSIRFALPNNIGGFGFTLSGDLYVKRDSGFKKMPRFGTRNILDKSSEIKTTGNFLNISIRFKIPYGLWVFSKISMDVVYKKESFSLIEAFDKKTLEFLRKKLIAAKTDKKKLEVIETFLTSRIINSCPELLLKIVSAIHESRGTENVAQLAKKFSTTERTINRHFNKYIGINPIEYINLIRFRSVINASNYSKEDPFGTALDAGYYDQSHFIKHFKEFSRVTPSQYFNSELNNKLSDFYNL